MQRVAVNRRSQGEGQGENGSRQQKEGGDLLLGRAAGELCSNMGENTGLFRTEYERRQSGEDSRRSRTSPVPYCYLWPLSTASLSAEAGRFLFKVQ